MIWVGAGAGEILGWSNVERVCTLGSVALSTVALGAVVGTFDNVSTLGDGVGEFRSFSTLLSASVIFYRVLCVGSPVCKLGGGFECGTVRMVLMSVAACLKSSSKFTFGIVISLEKYVTVSTSLTDLVGGKKYFMHL